MSRCPDSSEEVRDKLSRALSAQLERAREAVESEEDLASAVHETRRAIKRARALLRLLAPWPTSSPTDSTLRDASRALAPLRDADVLVLTAEDIRDGSPSSEPDLLSPPLLEFLEQERERGFAESGAAGGPLRQARELLRSVVVDVQDSPTSEPGDLLRRGLGASYASARMRSDPATGEGPIDERSHKLRKRVKDLRYQLEFLDTGQPELGRLVKDLYHLTDLLGHANDLTMLSRQAASTDLVHGTERAALTAHIDGRKSALRSEAKELSARLFAEEPDSFVLRIEAWVTAPRDRP